MIRRNFFYIAAGAIAALFVPKVAGAAVEKTLGSAEGEPVVIRSPETIEMATLGGRWQNGTIFCCSDGIYQRDGERNGHWVRLLGNGPKRLR